MTHSSVEVHRLIRQRWREFTGDERLQIEARVIAGPPKDWFREGADLERAMDRYRFALLSDFERSEVPLTKPAAQVLEEIRQRHPKWQSREPEKDGFLVWHGGVRPVGGDTTKLENVAPEQLVSEALKAKSEEDFLGGDSWQTFSQNEPAKAFEGIERAKAENEWIENVWRPFLWSANKIADVPTLNRIAKRLAKWPNAKPFDEVSVGAAWWLDEVAGKLDDEALWPVWELVFARAPRRTGVLNDDPFGTALNDAAGHLASILLKKIPKMKVARSCPHTSLLATTGLWVKTKSSASWCVFVSPQPSPFCLSVLPTGVPNTLFRNSIGTVPKQGRCGLPASIPITLDHPSCSS